jgi:hypothetical protein
MIWMLFNSFIMVIEDHGSVENVRSIFQLSPARLSSHAKIILYTENNYIGCLRFIKRLEHKAKRD